MSPSKPSVPGPLPPRDYPDGDLQFSARRNTAEEQPVTVRCILDRMAAEQTVTHDMISTAVTNLFTADALINAEPQSPRPASTRTSSTRVPKALTALIDTVWRH